MLTSLESRLPWAVTFYRVAVGIMFATHGSATVFAWPGPPQGGDTAPVGQWPFWWAGVLEIVLGVLIIVGLGTRIAAFLGSGAMAVAYFWRHQDGGLFPIENGGQGAALYCWALFLLIFVGAGKLSLDSLITRSAAPGTTGAPEPARAAA